MPTTSNNGVNGTWAPTINNQTTTTYTFTPDATECASSVDITVSILPSVTPAFSIANSYCQGEFIPALPTTSNNGIVGSWSPAINNQSTTAYVFTPNAGQCATVVTQTINVSPAVNAVITNLSNTTNLSCNTAAITLVASGGNSYSWSGGLGNASVATVTTAGTYTVTITNGACEATASITITQSPVSTPNAGTDGQTVLCTTAPSTNLFSFLGGSPQTGGTWSGPGGNLTGGLYNPSVHNEGVYYYIVTDASGCGSDTAQVVVEEETFVQATLSYDSPFCRSVNQYLPPTAISPSNGTFTPSPATGLAINANGAINPSLSTAGTYSINYAIGGVCPSQTSALVIIENNPSNVLPSNLIICPGDTESLTATSGEGYTYEWSNGATTQSILLNASNAGSYFVTITNDAGCTSVSNTATVNAGNAPVPTITPSGSVHICPNTTVQLTASAGASYEWSTGATTQSINAPAGSYWVTVTNSSGCSGTSETIVVDNENGAGTEIIASGPSYTELSEDTILICEGSALTLTAAPDNQAYLWTTGASSQSITVTTEGVYTVTSLTASGCSGNAQVTVLTIFAPNALTTPSPTLCGDQTAIICASPADSYEWSWIGAVLSTEGCIEIEEAGTYFVTMTNGSICETVDSIEVETISFLTCYLDEDGDGFGYDFIFIEECSCPNGYTSQPGDCDDNDPLQSPALDEICNDNIDNNCDGQTDENCVVVIAGCTDPSACIGVYNPAATLDDGTCTYPGCTYSDAINYDPQAGCDDGSCEFVEPIEGGMDAAACNYNASATIDNGSCEYVQLHAIEGGASYQIPESFCDTLYWYPYTEGSTYTWNAGGGSINAS
ncbi:MAG: MopE-related protein, partial [Flavobacteriales bacterium]